jgi:hypothetical protein
MLQNRNLTARADQIDMLGEDWLAMELEESAPHRGAAVGWCESHARPILSVASIVVWSLILVAVIFG